MFESLCPRSGAVTKPLGGAADLLVHTGQGLLHGAGWNHQHRVRFDPGVLQEEPHADAPNALLKLVWKVVCALPPECRAVLMAVEATHLTPLGTYTPVTLVLTPQVMLTHRYWLFLIGVPVLPLLISLWIFIL